MEPGKPLTFLDHHILCGNSLMGTTAKLIMGGIPDGAFDALDGDDKKATSALKRLNKKQLEAMKDKSSLLAEMYHQLKRELLQAFSLLLRKKRQKKPLRIWNGVRLISRHGSRETPGAGKNFCMTSGRHPLSCGAFTGRKNGTMAVR